MEEQDLYNEMKSDNVVTTANADGSTTYDASNLAKFDSYTLPILKCKSAGKPSTGSEINYIVNGGVLDYYFDSSGNLVPTTDPDPHDIKYSAFLTPFLYNITNCAKIDDLKSTSKTLVISENIQAGKWTCGLTITTGLHPSESNLAFVYPGYTGNLSSTNPTFGSNTVYFINEEPQSSGHNTARPSSNHPGMVVAGFADGGVRPLNETIATDVYIKLCQPAAGSDIDTGTDLGW
jgi:hypothetical protein